WASRSRWRTTRSGTRVPRTCRAGGSGCSADRRPSCTPRSAAGRTSPSTRNRSPRPDGSSCSRSYASRRWRSRRTGSAPRTTCPTISSEHLVAQVQYAGTLEDPDQVELDVIGAHVVEQPAAGAEQHRDLMDLEFVEHAGLEREFGQPRAVHHHVPVAGG